MLDKSVALWSLAAALKPRGLRPCLEKAVCPQSYFYRSKVSLSVSSSCSLLLYVPPSPARSFSFFETPRESSAHRAVTVNSLFVLLHNERREGSLYLVEGKIYTLRLKRGGYVEDSLLTVTLQSGRTGIVYTCESFIHRWELLTVHTPSWIHTPMHTVMSHLWDAETNYFLLVEIYGCLADCVNQIILKSIILFWEWFTECVCVCVCVCNFTVNIVAHIYTGLTVSVRVF